jgi:hypothetical protein
MAAPTKNQQWKKFREEVFELDGGVCIRCGRNLNDEKIFHVHHKEYIQGRLPWDYPYNLCETLCRGCHASAHGIIPPKTGWEFLDEEDLGDLCGTCDYCGNDIRYVFYIFHPDWETLGVGTNCCDNLTGTETASAHARLASRRARFVKSKRWKESNGIFSILQKQIEVQIHFTPQGFRICMNEHKGKIFFPTVEDAKKAAFNVIENGKAEKYLNKKRATAKALR